MTSALELQWDLRTTPKGYQLAYAIHEDLLTNQTFFLRATNNGFWEVTTEQDLFRISGPYKSLAYAKEDECESTRAPEFLERAKRRAEEVVLRVLTWG